MVIPPCRGRSQSITRMNTNKDQSPRNQMMTQRFLPRFTCLPSSQSLLWRFTYLEVHALIGITRQTLNRMPHNQHKMRITQATSNSLEYLLALRRGKVKNPSITMIRAGDKRNTNTKCLQMQLLKQCTWIHSQSHYDDESMMEMSGRALAKLTRLLCQCKWPRE